MPETTKQTMGLINPILQFNYSGKGEEELQKFLKPLVVYLRVIGVPLLGARCPSTLVKDRYWRWIGWLYFALIFGVISNEIYSVYSSYRSDRFSGSSTLSFSVWMITAITIIVRLTSSLTLLILCGSPRQVELIKKLDQLVFPGLRLRQYSSKVLFFFGLEFLLTLTISWAVDFSLGRTLWIDLFQAIVLQLTYTFFMGSITFYVTIFCLTIELFREFRVEITQTVTKRRFEMSTPDKAVFCLRKWKIRYSQLTQLVESINECCKDILLQLTTLFFTIIICAVFLAAAFSKNIPFPVSFINYYHVSRCAIFLILITYLPSKMRNEGKSIASLLRQLYFKEPDLNEKANFLMLEVLETLPRISVHGLFDVDLTMLPAMGGTMLTYLIITIQFRMAEQPLA